MSQANLSIFEYCRSKGLPFRSELIARYVAALLSKPFVILAGISGTGKSKLTQLVAEYYSLQSPAEVNLEQDAVDGNAFVFEEPTKENSNNFALVPVRPDWIDNQSILGFVNPLTGGYESTQALDIILRANDGLNASENRSDAERYFLLLDEMNLARVEHYFSDWLAATESRRVGPDGIVEQQPVSLHHQRDVMKAHLILPDGSSSEHEVPALIQLPTNLVVTGTVNVDETTYGFSPKVLDRAMVIEFDDVDLNHLKYGLTEGEGDVYNIPRKLPPFKMPTNDVYRKQPELVHTHLSNINKILEKSRLHIGYRSALEMSLFIEIFSSFVPGEKSDSSTTKALDFAILQKILPRLTGNRIKLEQSLAELCFYLRDLKMASKDLDVQTLEFHTGQTAQLPNSFRRAVEMLITLRSYGFVSFFK